MANNMNNMRMLLVVGIVLTLGYLVYTSLVQPTQTAPIEVESAPVVEEGFQVNDPANNATVTSEDLSLGQETVVDASEPLGENAQPKGLQEVESTTMNQLPSECYPKDVLSFIKIPFILVFKYLNIYYYVVLRIIYVKKMINIIIDQFFTVPFFVKMLITYL